MDGFGRCTNCGLVVNFSGTGAPCGCSRRPLPARRRRVGGVRSGEASAEGKSLAALMTADMGLKEDEPL